MKKRNYIFAATIAITGMACSNQETPEQDLWADEGIEVDSFPRYEGEEADTRATICALTKTGWESGDVIYVQLNGAGQWYTLTYSEDNQKWEAPEGFTMSRTDTYEAVYAPLYKLSDDAQSLVLMDGKSPFGGEYMTHSGKRPIRISFNRYYSRIHVLTSNATETEEEHWQHQEMDRWSEMGDGMEFSSPSYLLVTLGEGFTTPTGEPFTGDISLQQDLKGNIYIYGSWEKGSHLKVKSGTVADGLTFSSAMVDGDIAQASIVGNSYKIDASQVETAAVYNLDEATSSFSDTQITDITITGTWNSEVAPSFKNSTSLESVDLSEVEGLEVLPREMFSGCTNLTEVELPDDVTVIGYATFASCENLVMTSLPDGITEIGQFGLNSCYVLGLESLPESLTSIGEYVFSYSTVAFDKIPDSVTNLSSSAFAYCTFAEGTVLQLPSQLTSLPYQAFYSCKNLAGIILPSTITSLGSLSLGGCNNMNVVCYAAEPPSINTGQYWETFRNASNLTLQVPKASLEAYQNSNWANWFTSISAIEEDF
jgi:hypothetical protein